jgi:hypothetical protein
MYEKWFAWYPVLTYRLPLFGNEVFKWKWLTYVNRRISVTSIWEPHKYIEIGF